MEHDDTLEDIVHRLIDQKGEDVRYPTGSQTSGPLWSITEEDIALRLRERGLPVEHPNDLTPEERSLLRRYTHLVFDVAAREFADILAQRLLRDRWLAARPERP